MLEQKFVCPICGFESNGAGICPTCDENLQKVCLCNDGKFSPECCQTQIAADDKTDEELIKAEVSGEALSEIAKEDEEQLKEEEELANVKEIDEEK